MKTYLSYILFLALAIRPLYNVGYVTYFELNIDYIVETYCVNKEKPQLQCNGKCHLAKQLTNNTSSSSTNSYLTSFFEAFVPVYFQEYKLSSFYKSAPIGSLNNWNYCSAFNSVFSDLLDPPPRV